MDTEQLAVNLARNCGYSVFPCYYPSKAPATPRGDDEGPGGFHYASSDPDRIRELWTLYGRNAQLIGVRTGASSNRVILDLDLCHLSAIEWLAEYGDRLPVTRTHLTPRSGWHKWLINREGIESSIGGSKTSRLPIGIDVRAEKGYAIFWPAFRRMEVLDHSPAAPCPDWLWELAQKKEPPPATAVNYTSEKYDFLPYDQVRQYAAFIDRQVARVRNAGLSTKRETLRSAAFTLGGCVAVGAISRSDAETRLKNALPREGPNKVKSWKVAEATIAFGLDGGIGKPLQLENKPRQDATAQLTQPKPRKAA